MEQLKKLLNNLALYGGNIVSTTCLTSEDIIIARKAERIYVDENSLGFVWIPNIDKFPETENEVEQFEKWFPDEKI